MSADNRAVLAIDLGGTKVLMAIVTRNGEILWRRYYLTLADEGPRAVLRRLTTEVRTAGAAAKSDNIELVGLGVGVAGITNINRGTVVTSPNLPAWKNVAIRDAISATSELTTFLINDASAAALGEHRFGSGNGLHNMLYVTISTGIGGGIILNGELYMGTDGCAGEWGHMTIVPDGPKCHCGNLGCLEALSSGWAIARDAVAHIKKDEHSSIADLVNGNIDNITAEIVSKAAKKGDRLACELVDTAANYFGIGLANMVNIFNPELIIVGGGLSKMGEMFLRPARKAIRERAFHLPAKTVHIAKARLGSNAGVIGAAAYVFEQMT